MTTSRTTEPLTPTEEAALAEVLAGPDGIVMAHVPGRFLWVEQELGPNEQHLAWWRDQ